MSTRGIVFVATTVLAIGCTEQPDETQEIIENLTRAGFPADDIMVVEGVVYVGRDAEVSLAASREMLQTGDSSQEQYRTNNLVSRSLTKICVDGSTFTGAFSDALDLAIQNCDELPLGFAMARTPSSGCGYTINAVIQPGVVGGSAGFPSGGLPYPTINIGGGLAPYGVDVIEHVITHELGHTIGFRHSDYYNRSISCGVGGDEGDAGIGATLIPGTPSTATIGGSIMNSCFRSVETGELSGTDRTALLTLYYRALGDFNGDGKADLLALYDYGSAAAGLWTFRGTTGTTDSASASHRVWYAGPGNFDANRAKVSAGDFNGDGKADLLALYDYGSAAAGLWVFPGTTGTSDSASLPYRVWYAGPGNFDVNRAKVSAGDFNGDGKADLLALYDYGSAAAGLWVFPGTTGGASTPYRVWYVGPGNFDVNRAKVSAGDFNGDGKADLLALYDYGSAAAGLWTFRGTTGTIDGASAGYRVWYAGPGNFDVNRAKLSAGDFNDDGKTDLLALYDYGNAAAGLWTFRGTTGTTDSASALYRVWYVGPGNFDVNRAKVSAGDFNGDGKADLLALYDYGSAAAGLWTFRGTTGTTDGASAGYRVWYAGPGNFDVNRARLP